MSKCSKSLIAGLLVLHAFMTTVTRGAFIIRYLCTTTKNGSHSCCLYEEYVNSLLVTISKYVISFLPVTREKWVNTFRNCDKKWVHDNPAEENGRFYFFFFLMKKSELWYDLYRIFLSRILLIHVIIGLDYGLPPWRWQSIIPVISRHSLDIFFGFLRYDIQSDDGLLIYCRISQAWYSKWWWTFKKSLFITRALLASMCGKVFDTFCCYEKWELDPWGYLLRVLNSMVDPQQQVACRSLDPRTCPSLDPRLQMNCGLSAWCVCTMPSQSMYPPPPDTPHDTQYHTNNRGIMGDVHRLLHKLCTSQVLGCSVPRSSYGHKVVRITSKGETNIQFN